MWEHDGDSWLDERDSFGADRLAWGEESPVPGAGTEPRRAEALSSETMSLLRELFEYAD
jgi:hypothetical protein